MRRGDIVDVEIPRPQGKPGHEQFGTRPAVVIQKNEHNANLATVVVVPMTSNLKALHRSGVISVDPDAKNGLAVRSAVLVNQIVTVDKRRVRNQRGVLSSKDMDRVVELLRSFLDL